MVGLHLQTPFQLFSLEAVCICVGTGYRYSSDFTPYKLVDSGHLFSVSSFGDKLFFPAEKEGTQ